MTPTLHDQTPHRGSPQGDRPAGEVPGASHRRANRWLTLLTCTVVLAQVIAGCGPARTRGAAGGMDASLLESATAYVQVGGDRLSAAHAPSLPNVSPFPAPQMVDMQNVDPETLAALQPAAESVEESSTEPVSESATAPETDTAPAAVGTTFANNVYLATAESGSVEAEAPVIEQPAVPESSPVVVPETAAVTTDTTSVLGVGASGNPLDKTTNILVLGSDRREGAPNWLTDVMMIVALDYTNGKAGVISIPRDIYIDEIAGHQPNKLNVVDYLGEQDREGGGGPELLSNILYEKMGVRIDHYVRFDFRGFTALVDALGGVEVEIDCPYYDYFQIENVILNVKPGIERLSGDEALVYVRSRKYGGDLDRARRQQRFVWAVRNQVLNENILPRLPALYNAVSDSVQTDIGIVGTLKIARFALDLDKEDITGFVIGYPLVEEGYVGNMWVFRPHWDEIRAEVQNVFARDPFIDTNTLVECP